MLLLGYAFFKAGELQKVQSKLLGLVEINPKFQPTRQVLNDIAAVGKEKDI